MKGGATFNPNITKQQLRLYMGMSSEPYGDLENNIYRSPRRLLAIQEIQPNDYERREYGSEVGNLHAILITLPATEGIATYEYFPPIDNNYFKKYKYVYAFHELYHVLNNIPSPYVNLNGVHVFRDGISPKTRSELLASVKAVGAKGKLPDVMDQRIAAMAGLVPSSKESTPLTEIQSSFAKEVEAEEKADAIIDAGIAWVKAWNAEHDAPKGQVKALKAARVQAETIFGNLVAGSTSTSSSSSNAAPQGGRKKTRRSSKRRTTRRR